jgi:hypothetical protein
MKTHSDQNKSTSSRTNSNQPFFRKKEGDVNSFFSPTTLQPTPFFIQRQEEGNNTEETETESETTYTKGDYSGYFSTEDSDKLIIKKSEEIKSDGVISIENIRNKLVGDDKAEFTLNAVVRIAKYVENNVDGIDYSIPTDLSGTTDDNIKIVPNEIILGIALLQANEEVTIDGMPGPTFIKDVMGELSDESNSSKRKRKFMSESDNSESSNLEGETINVPDFNSDEATLYDFFRDITLARNGLWSDNENITNLTGIRRNLETTSPKWNDTIAVSWITKNNDVITKHSKIFTGTTEPGNLSSNKTLLPQTMIFKLGYHKARQPALRGHRTLSKKTDDSLLFNTKDERGLNAHPGGTTGKTLGMEQWKLPSGTVSTEDEFKANLIITEIFNILSRWGLDTSKSAYKNLKSWKDAKELIWGEIEGGKAKVYKEDDEENAKEIEIKSSKEWIAKYWVETKKDRSSLLKILKDVDSDFEKPEKYDEMTKKEILELIEDDHIESIIKKQIEYFTDLKSIDGKAGGTFIDILNGKKEKITDLQKEAETDFQRIEELFDEFDDNSVLTNSQKNYLKNDIKMQTLKEREAFEDKSNRLEDDQAIEINENVGPWSILCQVVFGPEKFYEFMMHVSNKSLESEQRRWYYTLIDLASLTNTNDTESDETDSGQVEVEK